ncbi:MAG: hypothetical protein AUK37_01335 [Rhodobacterales bacterium CG2_30_65_12]|nr:MAG: hypothetical protein AUK37_01335 [Rhodobacterales bacterium CG2_30_65_12]
MSGDAGVIIADPRWQKLMARGGLIALALPYPDGWPHGALAPGDKALDVGDDRLSPLYCTLQGHRFLRAQLLLPIIGARTVFAFACWGSVSQESWLAWLSARADDTPFPGAFAWLANALPGFTAAEPVPCNLVSGPPGQPPRLQPQPGTALHRVQNAGIDARRLTAIYADAGEDITALLAD